MSLQSKIAELDEQIKEIEGTEKEAVETVVEEKETEKKEEDAGKEADKESEPEAKGEPEKKEEVADDKGGDEKNKAPDAAAFARMRIEANAAKKRAEAAEARAAELAVARQPEVKKVETDAEPDKDTDPDAHVRWELRQANKKLQTVAEWQEKEQKKRDYEERKSAAERAFENYENNFKATVEDYQDVSNFGVQVIANSLRTLNPDLKGNDLAEAVKMHILRLSGQAEAAGHDPVEYLYHQFKTWGYTPKKAEGGEEKKEELKPDLKKIVENKKKSANSLSAGGKSGNNSLTRAGLLAKGGMTPASLARMTPAQFEEMRSLEAS